MFKFFKKRMSENKTPNETPAPTPAIPLQPEMTDAPVRPRETFTIRPEDVGEMPKGILDTPALDPVTPATPEAEAPAGKELTISEFVSKFTPVNSAGESLPSLTWEDFNNPGLMIGLIGSGKTMALAAAHQQKCWTVVKRPDGKLSIEAGMNSADQSKIGYLATRQPWSSLDVVVAQ